MTPHSPINDMNTAAKNPIETNDDGALGVPPHAKPGVIARLSRVMRHCWLDTDAAMQAVPESMAKQLETRIAASEQRHSGEIRIIVEGGLPTADAWQGVTPRERAIELFGAYGLWDTTARNGVLIYLLLADHAIEIVADRGLNHKVSDTAWYGMVERLSKALQAQDIESGLTDALAEISALLMQHFALPEASPTLTTASSGGYAAHDENPNELSDLVIWL